MNRVTSEKLIYSGLILKTTYTPYMLFQVPVKRVKYMWALLKHPSAISVCLICGVVVPVPISVDPSIYIIEKVPCIVGPLYLQLYKQR